VLDVTDECTAPNPRPWQVQRILNIRHFKRGHNERIVAVLEGKIGSNRWGSVTARRLYKLSIYLVLNDPESSESARTPEAKPRPRKHLLTKILAAQAGEVDSPTT